MVSWAQTYLRAEIDANNAVIIIGVVTRTLFIQHQIAGTTMTVSSQLAWRNSKAFSSTPRTICSGTTTSDAVTDESFQ
jgi:hypothetical protein